MKTALALVCAALVLTGCGHRKQSRRVPTSYPSKSSASRAAIPKIGYTETGIASWYGHPYHGRPAANGEIYDMEKLVAAHRTLPFDTWVRVYDLDNDKSVEVRIIDRGPFVDNRIIDISHAAAESIDMVRPGTAHVRMEVIKAPADAPPAIFVVQTGAFRDRANAERSRADMEQLYGTARLVERPENPGVWRVMVGAESTQDAAATLLARIRTDSGQHGFVVRLDVK